MPQSILLGPAARIDLDTGKFVPADQRRPLVAPALDHAWLWHRGSIFAGSDIPPAGGSGPQWWEGPRAWGVKGSLARYPRVLYISSYDTTQDTIDIVTAAFPALSKKGISVFLGPGNTLFPFLTGLPVADHDQVDQGGTFLNPLNVPIVVNPDLFRGGEIYAAAVTKFRVSFFGSSDANLAINDYTFAALDSTEFGGYVGFPDFEGPNPNTGFTTFNKDASRDRALMNAAADRCIAFHLCFYQSTAEAPGNGVDATDSSIVPDSSIDALLERDPRLSRRPYDDGDLAGAFEKIFADAGAFFP